MFDPGAIPSWLPNLTLLQMLWVCFLLLNFCQLPNYQIQESTLWIIMAEILVLRSWLIAGACDRRLWQASLMCPCWTDSHSWGHCKYLTVSIMLALQWSRVNHLLGRDLRALLSDQWSWANWSLSCVMLQGTRWQQHHRNTERWQTSKFKYE